jgi:enoyl-CoA hydratase
MDLDKIHFERAEGVATITLARPDARNAINVQMVTELQEVCEFLEDESDDDFVVIRGAGEHFSMGIDLRDFPVDDKPNVHGFNRWERVWRMVERLPKITLAVIDGECAGGGLQVAMACDVRVATDRATFRLHEVRDGFLPGMGTFRLAKFIGLGRARRMALTGRRMAADEALAAGLIDHLCAPAALDEAVAAAIAEFGTVDNVAVGLVRRLFDESFETAYEDFIGNFLAAQHRAIQSDTFRDGIRRAHARDVPRDED